MTNEETKTALLTMLKEDGKVIPYRPRISSLTGTTSAILLQQIYFRYDGSPFYKFKSPCSSPMYKVSDSWCEELGFLPGEFDTALRHIGTKCTKDKSKIELLAECPDIPVPAKTETKKQYMKRLSNALKHLVIYWTDSNHVTYYSFNTELFAKLLIAIYIDKLDFAIHGLNGESQFIFFTENKNTNIDSLPTNVGNTGAGASGAANDDKRKCAYCCNPHWSLVESVEFRVWLCNSCLAELQDMPFIDDKGRAALEAWQNGDSYILAPDRKGTLCGNPQCKGSLGEYHYLIGHTGARVCTDCYALVKAQQPSLTVEEADKALFAGEHVGALCEVDDTAGNSGDTLQDDRDILLEDDTIVLPNQLAKPMTRQEMIAYFDSIEEQIERECAESDSLISTLPVYYYQGILYSGFDCPLCHDVLSCDVWYLPLLSRAICEDCAGRLEDAETIGRRDDKQPKPQAKKSTHKQLVAAIADALDAALPGDSEDRTKPDYKLIGLAASELKAVNAQPDEMAMLAAFCHNKFDGSYGARAMSKYYAEFKQSRYFQMVGAQPLEVPDEPEDDTPITAEQKEAADKLRAEVLKKVSS